MRGLLAALCLVLAAAAAWPWLPFGDNGRQAAGGSAPAVEQQAVGQLPPLEALPETAARPLFVSSRRPPVSQELQPVIIQPNSQRSAEQTFAAYRLQGVVIAGRKRQVLLGMPGTNRTIVLEEGNAQDGWTVEKIEPEQLTLRAGERREVLSLRRLSR